jgi:hypothetical protein
VIVAVDCLLRWRGSAHGGRAGGRCFGSRSPTATGCTTEQKRGVRVSARGGKEGPDQRGGAGAPGGVGIID